MTFMLGPDHSAYDVLQEVPRRFDVRNGRIVVAWARRSGVGLLYSALGESLRNVSVVVGMANRGTSAEALEHLRSMSRNVFVYHKHHLQTFHPKVYLFDDGHSPPSQAILIVGSSNLTGGGLFQNIEGNLVLELRPSDDTRDRSIYDSVVQEYNNLIVSPFCEGPINELRIQELLYDRYISTEVALLRKRRRDNDEVPRRGVIRRRPEAPPPPLPSVELPPLGVTFSEGQGAAGPEIEPTTDDQEEVPTGYDVTEQFYVRTLTGNDVNKLHGVTPGTAEWDIGVTARSARPDFWGWPEEYTETVHTRSRLEWRTTGSLRSSSTPSAGVDVDIVLWFREERPGHASEHRLRVGPRGKLVNATPPAFSQTSLVVLERLPAGRSHTFLVHLLTRQDPEYNEYLPYLTQSRPAHRYGYGP